MKNNKGFTLVELLVVIAIIAVLSAIAIVNLNSARNKGNDAAVIANLAAFPAGGELYYDDQDPNTYVGLCGDSSVAGIIANLPASTYCMDNATSWAITTELRNSVYCIDSTGFASTSQDGELSTTTFGATDGTCE